MNPLIAFSGLFAGIFLREIGLEIYTVMQNDKDYNKDKKTKK